MAVYAATKNAVRTLLEGLRQESTDGVLRTTSVSPGFVRTELDTSIDDAGVREQIRRSMNEFGLPPQAVARAIAFAIEQPHDVEIGDITIRPTVQGYPQAGLIVPPKVLRPGAIGRQTSPPDSELALNRFSASV